MRFFGLAFCGAATLLAACTTSTIEFRKAHHRAAYDALPLETRKWVNAGQIQTGMDTNTVYLAWGRPSQTLADHSAEGLTLTWIYHGSWVRKVPYWRYTPNRYGLGIYDHRIATFAREFIRAEVVFWNNQVVRWRTFPPPNGD